MAVCGRLADWRTYCYISTRDGPKPQHYMLSMDSIPVVLFARVEYSQHILLSKRSQNRLSQPSGVVGSVGLDMVRRALERDSYLRLWYGVEKYQFRGNPSHHPYLPSERSTKKLSFHSSIWFQTQSSIIWNSSTAVENEDKACPVIKLTEIWRR